MSSRHLVNLQLRDFFDGFPELELNDQSIKDIRFMMNSMVQIVDDLPSEVSRQQFFIPGVIDSPEIRVLIYTPGHSTSKHPALLHMHGGGMVAGQPEGNDIRNVQLCQQLGVVVISVD